MKKEFINNPVEAYEKLKAENERLKENACETILNFLNEVDK